MLIKKFNLIKQISFCFTLTYLLFSGCKSDKNEPDVSGINVKIEAKRFERDLFSIDTNNAAIGINSLKKEYGNFFDLFAFQVTRLGSSDSDLMASHFRDFLSDTNFRNIYNDCEKAFGDFGEYNSMLT